VSAIPNCHKLTEILQVSLAVAAIAIEVVALIAVELGVGLSISMVIEPISIFAGG